MYCGISTLNNWINTYYAIQKKILLYVAVKLSLLIVAYKSRLILSDIQFPKRSCNMKTFIILSVLAFALKTKGDVTVGVSTVRDESKTYVMPHLIL